jgi:hypothetical protein
MGFHTSEVYLALDISDPVSVFVKGSFLRRMIGNTVGEELCLLGCYAVWLL